MNNDKSPKKQEKSRVLGKDTDKLGFAEKRAEKPWRYGKWK